MCRSRGGIPADRAICADRAAPSRTAASGTQLGTPEGRGIAAGAAADDDDVHLADEVTHDHDALLR